MTLSLIFMGTPQFAVPTLRSLVNAGHTIVAVYTAPPKPAGRGQKETVSPVHRVALEYNLPVFTPPTLKDAETQRAFAAHHADAAIVAAYGLLLPPPILQGTRMGCLNVHPSLLPRWRGAAPIQRAVMAGDTETGIVIMQMNAGLDTGDMLLTQHYDIPDGMNAGELHDVLSQAAGGLIIKTLEGLSNGTIKPVPQPETGVTYAKKISKEEGRIDWKQSASSIRHHILGLAPHPGAFFMHKGEAIKILDADVYYSNPVIPAKAGILGQDSHFRGSDTFAVGTVIDNHLTIICGEGALSPMTVQRPSKKPMHVNEMLKGYPIPDGTVLE
jgi:methionyl-tRNA formyltransferase